MSRVWSSLSDALMVLCPVVVLAAAGALIGVV